ncbi:MAG: diadenylate cyclase CdaA [candidate division Zixibacteria bacterium]
MILLRMGFLNFTLIDLIDILVVSFFFYRALLFLKEARSIQLIIGLFMVLAVSFLAFWFELHMVKWLFSNILIAGIIILAVLFQPELRRALARLGQSRLVRFIINPELKSKADAIVTATGKLAEMHYGALIVFERNVKLENIIESGKPLNSDISSELLQTIFTPYTPLHDGAVVVRGNQVLAANCTLPLSQNPVYHRLHGMRHKAGVGATEDSDAVVVIVSEETGQISYAHDGRLYRDIDPHELGDILSKFFDKG